MTVSVKITFTREDADTPWFHEAQDDDQRTAWNTYKMENYVDTNKVQSYTKTLSADELTMTTEWTIADRATLAAYLEDSTVVAQRARQKTYEDANGISRSAGDVKDD